MTYLEGDVRRLERKMERVQKELTDLRDAIDALASGFTFAESVPTSGYVLTPEAMARVAKAFVRK